MSSYTKALTFPSGATNDVFLPCDNRPMPPLSRHHIDPIPERSNVRGSHHLIDGQSVFHLYDQRCSAISSWRKHIASVWAATFYAPSPAKSRTSMRKNRRAGIRAFFLLGNHVEPNSGCRRVATEDYLLLWGGGLSVSPPLTIDNPPWLRPCPDEQFSGNVDSIVYSSQTTKMARSYFPDSTAQITLPLVIYSGSQWW